MLGMKARALGMLGKHSPKLQPQSHSLENRILGPCLTRRKQEEGVGEKAMRVCVRSAWLTPQHSVPDGEGEGEAERLSTPHVFQSLPAVGRKDARQMRSLDNLQRQGRLCGRWEGRKPMSVIPSNSLWLPRDRGCIWGLTQSAGERQWTPGVGLGPGWRL